MFHVHAGTPLHGISALFAAASFDAALTYEFLDATFNAIVGGPLAPGGRHIFVVFLNVLTGTLLHEVLDSLVDQISEYSIYVPTDTPPRSIPAPSAAAFFDEALICEFLATPSTLGL